MADIFKSPASHSKDMIRQRRRQYWQSFEVLLRWVLLILGICDCAGLGISDLARPQGAPGGYVNNDPETLKNATYCTYTTALHEEKHRFNFFRIHEKARLLLERRWIGLTGSCKC